jgi:hypothetical protein
MAEVYNPSVYNNLPLLAQAGQLFEAKQGNDVVKRLGAVFQKHGTERVFGLVLNHRHFDMSQSERLVEYHGTSVPWTEMLDKIRPSTWYISGRNVCSPYEFDYCADGIMSEVDSAPSDPRYHPFIESLNKILHETDLVGAFGLCRYPGDDYPGRVEVTEGRANINFHPDDVRSLSVSLAVSNHANRNPKAPKFQTSRPAAWFFSQQLKDGKCACICGGDGHTEATHAGHVATR